jgi:putative hydrolase of the HAD superfamily
MRFKAILTDLDGVIRHFPTQRDGEIETSLGLPRGIIAQAAFERGLLLKVTTGRITDRVWREEIRNKLATSFEPPLAEQAVARWSESPGHVDHEVLNFFLGLKAQVSLALLTNATDRLREDLSKLDIGKAFDKIFNSSELGLAKPDPGIFERVIAELGLDRASIFFVDDSAANVEVARHLGLAAHQFHSLRELKVALKSHGL